ncbi:ABC transporter permease [Leucobacter denitrificans]|uniref:ABC transporter permease subunit n=1 Tax=Leucobacter denitrificans TaxID=683042 RepID=A0A7G9S2M2_9MICO|nr:ABC transporter permease subunit [Leucobacter denitrificans]QNN62097.1 ABC transporter permease subunit [Leucobacter denitrificans]
MTLTLTQSSTRPTRVQRFNSSRIPIVLLFVYLGLPLLALLLFSFSRVWDGTVLPSAFTLEHWKNALQNTDVVQATGRSLFVTLMVCVINWIVVIPAAYIAVVVSPRLRSLFHALAIAPFALPWIVIAAGMQLTVGEFAPQLFATVGLLVVTISAVTFPYLYWAVESSLISNNVKQLAEAAQMSGAGWWQTITRVAVPSAKKGIMSGTLLVASAAFGEFAITQIIIGGAYETLPLWTLRMFHGRVPGAGTDLAAVSFAIFLVLFAVSMVLSRIDSDPAQPTLGGSQKLQNRKGVKR